MGNLSKACDSLHVLASSPLASVAVEPPVMPKGHSRNAHRDPAVVVRGVLTV